MTLEEMEVALGLLTDRVSAAETSITTLDELTVDLEEDLGLLTARTSAIETSTPTNEELMFSTTIPEWNGLTVFSSGPRMTLFCAPGPVRILGVDLSIEYSTISGGVAITSSNTNYWRLVLERGLPAGSFPDMTAKTTQISGAEAGGAIYTRKTWSFDSANWNSDRDLDKGDLLCLTWQKFGDPTDVRLPMTVTVRYAPK
jgi:hypothetical protein